MKIMQFHTGIIKIMKNIIISKENEENYENRKNPHANHENNANLKIKIDNN